jgi:CDP-glucose 4,6-dehydratase
MKASELNGLRVLVTGHSGFKGAWLTVFLKELGVEVIGLSDSVRPTSLYMRIQPELNIEEYFVDIRDQNSLKTVLQKTNPDGIFHLAAQPLVLESYEKPLETFEININGTANLILAANEIPAIRFVVVITTDKVYSNNNLGIPFVESSPLGGHDPYSASKAAVEIITDSLKNLPNRRRDLSIVTARAGNVIGGGDDSKNRLLPDITKSVLAKDRVIIRNPNSTRPWQHVLDPLAGYVSIAESLIGGRKIASAYNLGPNASSDLTVLEVSRLALDRWGQKTELEVIAPPPNSGLEAALLSLDSTLACKDLGWSTKLTAPEAIEWTVDWERSVSLHPFSAFELTRSQVDSYFKL